MMRSNSQHKKREQYGRMGVWEGRALSQVPSQTLGQAQDLINKPLFQLLLIKKCRLLG